MISNSFYINSYAESKSDPPPPPLQTKMPVHASVFQGSP